MPVIFYLLGLIGGAASAYCLMTAASASTTVYNQVDVFNFGLAHDTWLAIGLVCGIGGAIFIATGAITQVLLGRREID